MIRYEQTAEQVAREWTGEKRVRPVSREALPSLKAPRDNFALIALAVFVLVTVAALVVL